MAPLLFGIGPENRAGLPRRARSIGNTEAPPGLSTHQKSS
jgi:hypothetical protein